MLSYKYSTIVPLKSEKYYCFCDSNKMKESVVGNQIILFSFMTRKLAYNA